MDIQDWKNQVVKLIGCSVVSSAVIGWTDYVFAQRRPIADDTLGDERSIVRPRDTDSSVDEIEGGATRGDNLFHSFREFSIEAGRSAYFIDPGVANIISRVTGGIRSEILGTLGVSGGDANLFLINPSGIIFGPNALLNVGGSFVATTADAVQFGEQGFFNASEPNAPPLLTVSPSAFLFNQLNITQITNYASVPAGEPDSGGLPILGLRVPEGQSLLLVGGNVILDGGRLNALNGHVEVAGIAGIGTVGLSVDANALRLTVPDGLARADVSLLNQARIDVRRYGDGGTAITARNVEILGSSMLLAGRRDGSTATAGQPGDITINATGRTDLAGASNAGSSVIRNIIGSGTVTGGGNIHITTGSLSVVDGAFLLVGVEGPGRPGDITINAEDTVEVQGVQQINTDVFRPTRIFSGWTDLEANGGGDIQIRTRTLSVRDGAYLSASTDGRGDAGNIVIEADTVEFSGFGLEGNREEAPLETIASGAYSQVLDNAGQDVRGGNITVRAESLSLTNGGVLAANIDREGRGEAGNITIEAQDIYFAGEQQSNDYPGSGAYSRVEEGGIGNGGTITIRAGSIVLSDGGVIRSDFSGQGNGNGGDINITTGSLSMSDGAQLRTSFFGETAVTSENTGAIDTSTAGDINIQADQLSMSSNASIESDTRGVGQAGDIRLNVADTISLVGGETAPTGESTRITLGVQSEGTGSGGDLTVHTNSLRLTDGAIIKTSTQGLGDAGNVWVDAETVEISGSVPTSGLPSGLFASTDTTNRAGNITINTDTFRITDGAALSARTRGNGSGGSITVNTRSFEALNGGQLVTTTSTQGQAGNIIVDADRIILSGRDPNYSQRIERITQFPGSDNPLVANNITETGASSGLFASTFANSTGQGGNVRITADQLTIQNGAQATVSSIGSGNAGDLEVTARDLTLRNRATLSANTENSRGGNVRLQVTDSLRLTDHSEISATTQDGQGGSLILNADRLPTNSVQLLNNSRLSVQANGSGEAGSINLNTRSLTVRGNSEISASTVSGQQGGNITLHGLDTLQVNNGRISASTQAGRAGNLTVTSSELIGLSGSFDNASAGLLVQATGDGGRAGNLRVETEQLTVEDGATISASTTSGRGGGIVLHNLDWLQVDQATIAASTETGTAGNLRINADEINLSEGASLSVEATGNEGVAGDLTIAANGLSVTNSSIGVSSRAGLAGNLNITADRIQLEQGELTATTALNRGDAGANINLQDIDLLLMGNQSLISATATSTDANGGNITIDAGFIVAAPLEDSNIQANARAGNGGRVEITTQGLFGIEAQERDNPLTNDITASSEQGVQGTVTIDTPDVDPRRGLTELPTDVVDASNQITQTCPTETGEAEATGEFVVTGRGGLPPSPIDSLIGEESLTDWATLDQSEDNFTAIPSDVESNHTTAETPIVEAQSWVVGENGKVMLVAATPVSRLPTSTVTTHCR